MAGLSDGRPRPDPAGDGDRRSRTDDRGQLLLVFAFGMAVLLVVLALLLTGAIHAGNAATRSVDGGAATDAVEFRYEAGRTAERTLVTVNAENDSSYATLGAALRSGIDRWAELRARHGAAYGRGPTVSLVGTRNGTRIVDANRTRALTNESGVGDWTLVEGSAATRDFRLNVSRASLVEAAGDDENASALKNQEVFRAVLDDGDAIRRVYVYQDGLGDVLVRVGADSGSLSDVCRHPEGADGHVLVDLSNATLGGDPCPPLAVFDAVGSGHSVAYADGENATGTYSLVVDRPVGEVNDSDFAARDSGDSPVATPVLYGATIRVSYRTHRLDYAGTVSVVPGENGD